MRFLLFIGVFVGLAASKPSEDLSQLQVKYGWASMDFLYENEQKKQNDLSSQRYIPENIVIMDYDTYTGPDGVRKEFVTCPSFRQGVPFTLGTVVHKPGSTSPSLKPFPNEKFHDKNSCDSIVSAFRVRIDKKGRLWVMDSGRVETSTPQRRTRCGPAVWAFDLNNNNKLITMYRLPQTHYDNSSFYINLEVEITPDDTYVYLADTGSFRMAVYRLSTGSTHFFSNPYFYPDPVYGFYQLNGVNFTLMNGIMGMSLVKDEKQGGNILYFNGLSSGRESMVRTDILKDPARSTVEAREFKTSTQTRRSHVTVTAVTNSGVMIFPSLDDNAMVAWDMKTEYNPAQFKVFTKDRTNLQFPTGVKIVGDELYVVSNRLQNLIGNRVAQGEINNRVLSGKLNKLLDPKNLQPFAWAKIE